MAENSDDIDLGASPLSDSNGEFVIAKSTWQAIQSYAVTMGNLPTTKSEMMAEFELDDHEWPVFERLLATYQQLSRSGDHWETDIMPEILQLCGDVLDFSHRVQTYYNAIEALVYRGQSAAAKKNTLALFEQIEEEVKKYEARAERIEESVTNFLDRVESDNKRVKEDDKHYHDKFDLSDQRIQKYNNEIDEDKNELETAQEEYDQDVNITSTTPTYGWIWPFGTIASAVAAGVYGHRAVEAKHRIEQKKDEIAKLEQKKKQALHLRQSLKMADKSINQTYEEVSAGLKALRTIRQAWISIDKNIDGAVNAVTDANPSELKALIERLALKKACRSWSRIATEAQAFHQHAIIKTNGMPKSPENKVERLFAA